MKRTENVNRDYLRSFLGRIFHLIDKLGNISLRLQKGYTIVLFSNNRMMTCYSSLQTIQTKTGNTLYSNVTCLYLVTPAGLKPATFRTGI